MADCSASCSRHLDVEAEIAETLQEPVGNPVFVTIGEVLGS
jgi:hypothetical protein